MSLNYSTVNKALLNKVTRPGYAGESWNVDSGTNDHWARELVARVAVLVGTNPIEYASGYIEEVDGVDRTGAGIIFKGEAAVFTSSTIVHAKFDLTRLGNAANFTLEAAIVSYRRSDIDSVSSESISGDLSSSANSFGSFIVHLRGGESIALPVAKRPQSAKEQDLLEFVSTILN